MSQTDKIVKEIVLRAPLSRVWRALSDIREFGDWFGFTLEGEFAPGQTVRGTLRASLDEAGLIAHQESLGLVPSGIRVPGKDAVFCTIERVEPERNFSFRWVPYGIDADADLANEPTTLVEFHLEAVAGGTSLTITESGFDRVPDKRRARAFRMNQGGWAAQSENLRAYVERA